MIYHSGVAPGSPSLKAGLRHSLAATAPQTAWSTEPSPDLEVTPSPLPLTLLLEDSSLDEFERQKDGALLLQCGGVGRHGARRDAPNVRMVPTACHVEHRPSLTRPKHLGVESDSELC